MTKKEYWAAHVAKNPKFADEENQIKLSVKMLRQLLEEAYDKGFANSKSIDDVMKNVFNIDLNKHG